MGHRERETGERGGREGNGKGKGRKEKQLQELGIKYSKVGAHTDRDE